MNTVQQTIKSWIKAPLEFTSAQLGAHRRHGPARLWIMMYHRILPASDPRSKVEEPGMMVTPDTFRMHLKQFRQFFDVMPLSEWVDRAANGQALPPRACAITFDDGWADNYEFAFPILQEEQLPATLFAVSAMSGSEQLFWPNRLASLLSNGSAEQLRQFDWLNTAVKNAGGEIPMDCSPGISLNRDTFSAIVQQLKTQPDNEIHALLDDAEHKTEQRAQLETEVNSSQAPALMNWDQLRNISQNPLFDIGSHTRHHYRLREDLNNEILLDEIVTSKRELQEKLDTPIDLFCYPNGDYSDRALQTVRENYRAAVTTAKGLNHLENCKLHQLNRIGLHEDISNTPIKLQARLANWI